MNTPARRVLVTGGASGLGLALARQFGAAGDRVLAADLAPAPAAGTLPDGVEYLTLDVRDQADWDAALAWVTDNWCGLDLLVNNADVASGGRIDVSTMQEWQRLVDINLLGVVRGCRTFTPLFKQQASGHIVNTASLAGLAHGPAMSTYNAVKAAVVALSETLSYELAPHGIAVSAICPSFFRTNLAASLQGSDAAMEVTAGKLISRSPRSADEFAARVIRGIDRRKRIILTEKDGYAVTWTERLARPLYDRSMAKGALRIYRYEKAQSAGEKADPAVELTQPAMELAQQQPELAQESSR